MNINKAICQMCSFQVHVEKLTKDNKYNSHIILAVNELLIQGKLCSFLYLYIFKHYISPSHLQLPFSDPEKVHVYYRLGIY